MSVEPAEPHAPPSLLVYDDPVLVNAYAVKGGSVPQRSSAGTSSAAAAAAGAGVAATSAEAVKVLHAVFPPRCVLCAVCCVWCVVCSV